MCKICKSIICASRESENYVYSCHENINFQSFLRRKVAVFTFKSIVSNVHLPPCQSLACWEWEWIGHPSKLCQETGCTKQRSIWHLLPTPTDHTLPIALNCYQNHVRNEPSCWKYCSPIIIIILEYLRENTSLFMIHFYMNVFICVSVFSFRSVGWPICNNFCELSEKMKEKFQHFVVHQKYDIDYWCDQELEKGVHKSNFKKKLISLEKILSVLLHTYKTSAI